MTQHGARLQRMISDSSLTPWGRPCVARGVARPLWTGDPAKGARVTPIFGRAGYVHRTWDFDIRLGKPHILRSICLPVVSRGSHFSRASERAMREIHAISCLGVRICHIAALYPSACRCGILMVNMLIINVNARCPSD